jgi:SAM-dependent methyltransferase
LSNQAHREAAAHAQEIAFFEGFNYESGSPHLRHTWLRGMVEDRLTSLVDRCVARSGRCQVLEIGAGHGTFTQCLLNAGATVTVTETSPASADRLRESFGDAIEVRYDQTGEGILDTRSQWDLVVMSSVVHHIPDYLSFLERLVLTLVEDGAILTVQDPLYYPRRSKVAHKADRAAYLAWRLFQGDYGRGMATRLRRLRGVYSDTEVADLAEYHVVRNGVDEEAIRGLFGTRFSHVEVFRYWSTQSRLLQRMGDQTSLKTTFGVQATGLRR